MILCKNSTLEVIFDPVQVRLCVACGHSFQSDDFRNSLLEALAFARKYQVKHWLLDLRAIGELSEADETWVYAQLFPEIMMQLGTGNYMAMLLSQPCYERLLEETGQNGLTSMNSFVILRNFYDPAEAAAWLDTHHLRAS